MRIFFGVNEILRIVPESPIRLDWGTIEAAVILSGYKLVRTADVNVALDDPDELDKLAEIPVIAVSELGFLKFCTTTVSFKRLAVCARTIVTIFWAMLHDVTVIPSEDDVQRARVVLGVNEPGEGTLKTNVSPVLKKPVEL